MGKKLCPLCDHVWAWDTDIIDDYLHVAPARHTLPVAVCPECDEEEASE